MKNLKIKQLIARSTALSSLLAIAFFAVGMAQAQTTSVFTTGLSQPAKITQTPLGNFLVTETLGPPNSGRISIIDQNGNRRTLIDGLPSGISAEGPSGPTGIEIRGRTLFVAIGEGDGVLPGPVAGTQVPNPNPSSPLLSSVLEIHLSAKVERFTQGFSLSLADQNVLANGGTVTLNNGNVDSMRINLLVDFPNSVPNPLPFFTPNVRQSNPFALAANEQDLYVADAGMNAVIKVNIASGERQTLMTFPPRPNPLPFGPPFIEAVPDGIRLAGNQLLVTLLTGFPFVPGLSEVKQIDIRTGDSRTIVGGRSSAIDVLPEARQMSARGQYYVLEFSTNLRTGEPGQLLLVRPPFSPSVIASGLIAPSGMIRDAESGDIFITEIFTGRIIRVHLRN